MDDLRKFARYFRPYKKSLITGILCILASVIIALLIPLIVGHAVDDLTRSDISWTKHVPGFQMLTARFKPHSGITWGKLTQYSLTILGVSLISGAFLFLQRRILIGMSRHIEYDLRRDFYAHLIDQPLSFFQEHRTGDLMARATNDLAAVRQLAGPMIMYTLQTIFVVIIILPLMLRISVRLTLLLFVTMPLVSLTVKFFGQQVHVRFEKIQDFFAQISARAQENFSGVRVVRAYAQENAEIAAFESLNTAYANRNLSLVRISAVMRPLMQFLIGAGFVLIIWYGGTLAARHEITAGEFTEFNLYLTRLIWPLIALGYVVNLYQRGTASLKRMNAIWAIQPTITDAEDVKPQPPIQGRIELRNLTFSYRELDEPVLQDINLTIEAGQSVALVGRTGSGKSTLANIIPRLIDAPPDTVFIDGIPLRDYPLAQLRAGIGYVPQETFLFSDTLAENIAFGVEESERAEIEWAAEIAGLAEDISGFPKGFETMVGERGITLSGGQKQRTAIARAVMRQPKILILDDALSSVDTYTEEKILGRLRGVMRDRTSIIISHRISTVRDADLICVLDDGRIVERGTHSELLALRGEYADLYERQLLEEELAAS
ncbi:MAG: ATP-binding cassette, subfamily multidrug efflux pump [Acidobacteriota bacterium]|jgi:ATP-binding cassette subfamily B protein|nr:ATP-binding cassette, subfamily multidrug efflux pump [Acidobacteriota bacterium]